MMDSTYAGVATNRRIIRMGMWLSPPLVALLLAPAPAPAPALAGEPARRAPVVGAQAEPTPESVKWYRVRPSYNGEPEFLYAIAERFLGNGDRNPEIFALNEGRLQPGGLRMTSPAVIEPGWILVLPEDAEGDGVEFGPVPTVAPPPRLREPTPTPGGVATTDASRAGDSASREGDSSSSTLPIVLLTVALLAASGAGGFLLWRRRTATAPAGVGSGAARPVASPGRPGSTLTASGRPASAPAAGTVPARPARRFGWLGRGRGAGPVAAPRHFDTAASWTVDRALRVLATGCAAAGQPLPEFYSISLSDDRVVLRLTAPGAPAPAPWQVTEDGLGWSVSLREVQAAPIDAELPLPPLRLVTLGTAAGARILLDLGRSAGLIGLGGDPATLRALISGWVTELVDSPWSDRTRVVVAGVRDVVVTAAGAARVTVAAGPREVPAAVDAAIQSGRPDLPGDAAGGDGPDVAVPGVLFLGAPPAGRDAAQLRFLLSEQRPDWSVVVLGAGDEARWTLTVQPDGVLDTGVLGIRAQTGAATATGGR
jgi:hypothetical protein